MTKEISKKFYLIANKINEIEARIDNFFNGRCDDNASNIEVANETTDLLLTEVIPEQNGQIVDLNATIDMILTDIIPNLFGDE